MFEDMTYENILSDMLGRVSNDVDKREGSIIYDAISPCAYYVAQAFFIFANSIDLYLLDTAVGELLDRIALGYGINRILAVNAVLRAGVSGDIEPGTRYGYDGITYTAIEKIEDGYYKLHCDQSGEIGNYIGKLENIDNLDVDVEITEILIPGEEEEEDDHFRQRILDKIQLPITSGNKYQYKVWATEVKGVGAAKVFPLANGPGTVKVIITDSNKSAASNELIQSVADHIGELRPIGATVTVVSAVEKPINIAAKVTLINGADVNALKEQASILLTDYLKGCAFDTNYISVAKIGNLLWDIEGIEDYTELTLNQQGGNVLLENEEVAIAGTINFEVVNND